MTKEVLTVLLVNAAVFSVLFIIMLAVKRLVGKRLSPFMMLILWAVAVIKLLIPYGFESDFAVFAAPQTVTTAAADASTGDHVNMPVTQDVVSFDEAQPDNVISDSGSSPQPDTQALPYQTKSPIPAATVDWTMVAFGVWAAGALAVAAVFGIGSVTIRRRMRHAQLRIPDHLRDIFEECGAQLGIKRRIGLKVQSAFGMPMMMGAIRPCLVLPENALTLDKKTLQHIMLHELSHWRRGDLLLIWVLNLLSAVYWFNPLTWLCFKLIRDDIETACDHSVFKVVGQDCRLDYINTILHFAGSDKQQRLAAAMALSHRRSGMEKRITGMFRSARTQMVGRCAAVCVALLMLCISVFTACQPTPDKPVVVNKNDGKLEEKIAQTVEPQASYEAPTQIKDTLTKNNTTVSIDADVIIPDVTAFPVYEVQPIGFTQEQVDTIGSVLLGDKDLYSLPEGKQIYMSKDQVMEQIVQEKAQLEEVKKMGDKEFNNVFDGESREDAYAGYEQRIKEWEEQYKSAPDVWGEDKLAATLTLLKKEFGEELIVFTEAENGIRSGYYVTNSIDEELGATICQMEYTQNKDYVPLGPSIAQGIPENVTISKDDAIKQAEKLIEDMGISDMAVANAGVTQLFLMDNTSNRDTKQCWIIQFERIMDSITVSAITGSHASDSATPRDENEVFTPAYNAEDLCVYIGDIGVLCFQWSNVAEVTAKRSDNVELMPFDDVMERAKDNLFYKVYGEDNITVEISINQVKLSLMRIGKRDDKGTFLIVPVWDFIGNMQLTLSDGHEIPEREGLSYLTLNAIDGSVIDREKGY